MLTLAPGSTYGAAASAGVIRLPANKQPQIALRRADGSGDVSLVTSDGSDNVTLGDYIVGTTTLSSAGRALAEVGSVEAAAADANAFYVNASLAWMLNAATTGTVRLPQLASIRARNNAGDGNINIASASSGDVITYGGTANQGVILATSTGNGHSFQVNGVEIARADATLGLSTAGRVTTGVGAVGTASPSVTATTGALATTGGNVSGGTVLVAYRNTLGTLDYKALSVAGASNALVVGDTANTFVSIKAASGIQLSTASRITTVGTDGQVAFDSASNTPGMIHSTRTSDTAPVSLTLTSQAPLAGATGANRKPGDVLLNVPAPTNGGTTRGRVVLQSDGAELLVADKSTTGVVRLRFNSPTQLTVGAAGAAAALPSAPSAYGYMNFLGTDYVVPLYLPA